MNKQNRKTLAWSTAVLTLTLISTACSGGNGDSSPSPSTSPSSSAAMAPSVSPSASPSASPTESASASPSDSGTRDMKTASGVYQGMSDSHSIEITVDGKPESFQVSPETADKISAWETGTNVKFQYIEEELEVEGGNKTKQKTITEIDKA